MSTVCATAARTCVFLADVALQRQRLAAGGFDFGGGACGWCRAASDWRTADFAAMATLAPSRAARSAIARPMPREAPVMNRVLPDRVDMRPLPRKADSLDREPSRAPVAQIKTLIRSLETDGRSQPSSFVGCLLAAGELERSDPRAPVEGAGGLQVLGGIPEGAVVDRVDRHRAVVAPAVEVAAALRAGAVR